MSMAPRKAVCCDATALRRPEGKGCPPMRSLVRRLCVMVVWALALVPGAEGRSATLEVGENKTFKLSSNAAAQAKNGDTIDIYPGEYFDCSVWRQNNITIVGKGSSVIITDKMCEGKGLILTYGNDITIRNLTLERARVPDGNGAGIREHGVNLTVDSVKFINNENGILHNNAPQSEVRIINSEFIENGFCANKGGCAHGIYFGTLALLRVEGSKFLHTKNGHHIKSRAARTELVGNEIRDGDDGTASYHVDISNGGSLILEKNIMQKGPKAENRSAAVVIGAEGITQRTVELIVKDNEFTNTGTYKPAFVRNLSATPAMLTGNKIKGEVTPLLGDGTVR